MKSLLLATRNEGKLREFTSLLAGEELGIETLDAHPDVGEVEETGKTFGTAGIRQWEAENPDG